MAGEPSGAEIWPAPNIGREEPFSSKKVLLVGNPNPIHIGAHLKQAADVLGLRAVFCDSTTAFDGPKWRVKFNWWLRGHRPTCLRKFSEEVVKSCQEFRPSWMVSVGMAPVEAFALEAIGNLGVKRLNYLTDNPWNPVHRAPWFLKALPHYDQIFSLRRSNLEELRAAGCSRVSYLPFAYAPELHYREPPATREEEIRFNCDVVFAGGADRDRVPYIAALIRGGFKVGLYGTYWERYRDTRMLTRGPADARTLRVAIGSGKVALCLVRRANRDGNSMRTFEVAAIGACMLTEDTEEHREIFGKDGEAVVYFRTIDEMLEKLRWLLANEGERKRLTLAAREKILGGKNTYTDRLRTMLHSSGFDGGRLFNWTEEARAGVSS